MATADDFRRQVFIEWLCTPKRHRDPATQQEFAEQHGLDPNILTRWKQDREFLAAWEVQYLSTIGSPERKQDILDVMLRTATDPDDPRHVQAGKTYMELVEGVKPQRLEVTVDRPAAELSDDQLDAAIARHAERERGLRLVEES